MYILGISAFYHDSAAVLVKDGKIISAIEEERFTRIKHDNRFPFKSIDFCLRSTDLKVNDIDIIIYYEKPLLKFERLLDTFLDTFPNASRAFTEAIPDWLGQKIKIENIINNELGFKNDILYIPHHVSHAAAGYYTSPFDNTAILTIDGVGEYQTAGLWTGLRGEIKPLYSIEFPHSIGLLYSAFTAFLGFKVNEDEYKLMGLSAYGKPIYTDKINRIIDVKSDGSFRLDMSYFSFREKYQMWSQKFETLFGAPRLPKDKFKKRHRDLASSIQQIVEEIYMLILNHLYKITLQKNLCISGGVALNALANGKIFEKTPFRKIHILGAAGDSGAAIGSALFTYYNLYNTNKHINRIKSMPKTLYTGTSYSCNEIFKVIKRLQENR